MNGIKYEYVMQEHFRTRIKTLIQNRYLSREKKTTSVPFDKTRKR